MTDKNYRIRVEGFHGFNEAEWEQRRLDFEGSFYLGARYAGILRAEKLYPLFFYFHDETGRCVGLGLGHLTDQWRRWPLRSLVRRLVFETYPAVSRGREDLLNVFMEKILQYTKEYGVSGLEFRSIDAPVSPTGLDKQGMIPFERIEFVVDLAVDDGELMQRISSRKRSQLRKIDRSGELAVRECRDQDSLIQLIDFQSSSRDRRRRRGEEYAIASRSSALPIYKNYIEPGNGRLFMVYSNEIPLAGILLHCGHGRAYYTMAGSSPEGFSSHAPSFLVWQVMRILRDDGYTIFNLGGVPGSARHESDLAHGLYRFKNAFGGREVRCINWRRDNLGWRSRLRDMMHIDG